MQARGHHAAGQRRRLPGRVAGPVPHGQRRRRAAGRRRRHGGMLSPSSARCEPTPYHMTGRRHSRATAASPGRLGTVAQYFFANRIKLPKQADLALDLRLLIICGCSSLAVPSGIHSLVGAGCMKRGVMASAAGLGPAGGADVLGGRFGRQPRWVVGLTRPPRLRRRRWVGARLRG